MKIKNLNKQKSIALVAHDNKKENLVKWVEENKDSLSYHFLFKSILIND